MMAHAASCACALCAAVRDRAFPTRQSDRDALADAWELWIGTADGEVRALRMGHAGNPGSLRWVALQAIAATRVASTIDAAIIATRPAGSGDRPEAIPLPEFDAPAVAPAGVSVPGRPVEANARGPKPELQPS